MDKWPLVNTEIGEAVTEDHVREAHMGRVDAHSVDARIEAFRAVNAMHLASRRLRNPPEPDFWMKMWCGLKGDGKSSDVVRILIGLHMMGLPVYHTASSLVGVGISAEALFDFVEDLDDGFGLFVDEVHAFIDKFSEGSHRNRKMGNGIALLRKINGRVLLASAREKAVAWSLKEEVDEVIYPEKYKPLWDPSKQRFPEHCYIKRVGVGPRPYEDIAAGKTLAEIHGIKRRNSRPARKYPLRAILPSTYYNSSKLLDTRDKPHTAAFDVGADTFREREAERMEDAE